MPRIKGKDALGTAFRDLKSGKGSSKKECTALVIRDNVEEPTLNEANYDLNNPRSMVSLLPKFLYDRVKLLPARFFVMTEEELAHECFGGEPNEVSRRLRLAFWEEYDRCQRYQEKEIDIARVVTGICNMTYFKKRFIADWRLLCWILQPPPLYMTDLKDIHEMSLRRLLEVAKLPIERDEKGKVDTKLIDLQQKIFAHVDMRIKGAIVQKIDQRNLSVNVDVDPDSPEGKKILDASRPQHLSMSEVESKIKALESKSLELQAPMRIETDLMRETLPVVDEDLLYSKTK